MITLNQEQSERLVKAWEVATDSLIACHQDCGPEDKVKAFAITLVIHEMRVVTEMLLEAIGETPPSFQ